jgi:hypothetical protein
MRNLREAAFVFVLLALAGAESNAQTNWVRCQHTLDGTIQSFPNQCPMSWFPL